MVAFERQELERIGMPDAIAMRHRTPHFQHVFSGGYSAAYYSYLWSEVLDADGFEAFEESGDIFDPDVAKRLEDFVYAAGGSRDYDEAYRAFRGRGPSPEALFRKRGLRSQPRALWDLVDVGAPSGGSLCAQQARFSRQDPWSQAGAGIRYLTRLTSWRRPRAC